RLVPLRTDQGDECSTGNEGIGQTERLRRTMVLQHLFEHGIRRGFRLIQECHSAFLGACRASRLLEEGVPGTPHTPPGRCVMCCRVPRMCTRASQSRRGGPERGRRGERPAWCGAGRERPTCVSHTVTSGATLG